MSFFNNIHWSPESYTAADVIAKEGRAGILERLTWITITPNVILDIGSGTGELAQELKQKYPKAEVWAVDSSRLMLDKAQDKNLRVLPDDAAKLSFSDDSVDMIVANLLIPWHSDHTALLQEWRRILRPDGLLMLTGLGPDTIKECRTVFANEEIPYLMDMHDFGDLLLQAGFSDPVLDVDYFTLAYQNQQKLLQELKDTNMWFPTTEREVSLESNQVTYEMIFAHAFMGNKSNKPDINGEVKITLASVRNQLKSNSSAY